MGGMFSKPKMPKAPPPPKPVRMPDINDPATLAAAERTKEANIRRMGRQQTILTQQNRETTGSSGQRLGA